MIELVNEQYIVAEYSNNLYPIIKVCQQNRGIIISYIGTKHHYSLHLASIVSNDNNFYLISQDKELIKYPKGDTGDTPIIFTSFDLDKSKGTWSKEKVEVANCLKLKNTWRHSKYYENRILPLGCMKIFPLGGRRVYLIKDKIYNKDKCIFYKTKKSSLFIEVLFSKERFFDKDISLEIETKLGNLGFKFS